MSENTSTKKNNLFVEVAGLIQNGEPVRYEDLSDESKAKVRTLAKIVRVVKRTTVISVAVAVPAIATVAIMKRSNSENSKSIEDETTED